MTQTITDGRQISIATETVEGVAIQATEAEVLNRDDVNKYVSPDYIPLVPGTGTSHWNQNVNGSTGQSYQYTFTKDGTYRLDVNLNQSNLGGGQFGPADIDGMYIPIKESDDLDTSPFLQWGGSANIGAGRTYTYNAHITAAEGQTITFVVGEPGESTNGTIQIRSK